MGKPTFIVAGAQKSGTTWLFECLVEHPQVFVPDIKETQFFSRPEDNRFSRMDKGIDWYEGLFPDTGFAATGEVTPDYMFYPYCASALHGFNPDLKIVFILRDPVERAYSAYWMERRHRRDMPAFSAAIRENPRLIERGFYFRQLARYYDVFPAEQLRVYIYEEATRDPEPFVEDLFGFLRVDAEFRPRSLHTRVGGTQVLPPPFGFLLYKVLSPVVNTPVVLPLWRALRRRTRLKETVLGAIRRKAEGAGNGYQPMDPAMRTQLAAIYREENAKLFDLLGRTVPAWTR